ncbi:LysM peptidoglycan-binding domain-containing protein [Fulvivirga ligni]|uniref:LysM peptidoglycan-binding domain-containing protein n=1 Tax=Fulvivirga ligni TaxID=2904246 RepID=UPI001F29538F|nr:LysM peptidoglycan-binding domain-containing protein [Fulvivirga ligni]UII23253.1 LysM peptidoglycan-binding domain-containing protein [Fulvivirga ligni]
MRYFLLVALLGCSFYGRAEIYPMDSVGVEKKDGKVFILHKVEDKETLYSLSRRYNVSIYNIIEHNPPVEFGLEVGQIVKIPYQKAAKTEVVSNKPNNTTPVNNTVTTPKPVSSDPGKKIHVVKPKETIYSISKMYGITREELREWNGIEGNVLDIGQELIIKQSNTATATNNTPTSNTPAASGDKIHEVKAGETLYSLSKKYDVAMGEIMVWNDLQEATAISVGQKLIVGKSNGAAETNTVKEEPVFDHTKPVSSETTTSEENQFPSIARKKDSTTVTTPKGTMEPTFKKEIIESGNAQLIDGSGNTRKYLALHRTAKVGTIMKVRNEMNGQEVFVRVMGKLPDTGVNDNVLIRISKSAYDRLGAIDPKFRVSLSYLP